MHDTGRNGSARTPELEENVSREFQEQPEMSTWTASTAANVSYMTLGRVLGIEGLRTYQAQCVHALKTTDHQLRDDSSNDWLGYETLPHTYYSSMNAVSVGKTFSMHTTERILTLTLSVLVHINGISASMGGPELYTII
ncbi:hypothetical protein TNCV_3198361 [Trichonephila clavipes]|nr:hypothetical protein TNCV_3198361 [Trichonephila clavipes]